MELVPLRFGWEVVPRSLSLAGAGGDPVREPVTGALVSLLGGGWLLLDAGLTPDDPPGLAGLYPHGAPEREPLAATLARVGADVGDIRAAAVSHLHLDHTGGLRELRVPVWVQRAELTWAAGREVGEGVWRGDLRGVEWAVLDGDAELVPGVRALFTPGHTPGHMSFAVGERWVLACDAIDLAEGLEQDVEIGPATDDDDPAARRASHERLTALVREGRTVVPGHCPRTWHDGFAFSRIGA